MECELRYVNFRRVSDPRRVFLPALRVNGSSDNWNCSTMAVTVIGLGTPWSARENLGASGSTGDKPGRAEDNIGSIWERL